MLCKKFLVAILVAVIGGIRLFAFEEDFSVASYSGGSPNLPSGWTLKWTGSAYATVSADQPLLPPDSTETEMGLGVNFYSATKENLFYRNSKIDDTIVCDTLLAKVRVYVEPKVGKVDSFRVVVSTNAWASYEVVGKQIDIEDSERVAAGWVTFSRQIKIDGLANSGNDVYVGILFTPDPLGKSHDTGYIRSISLSSAAAATPMDVCLKHKDGAEIEEFIPGDDYALISAQVIPDPNDSRIQLEGVYSVIEFRDDVVTNRLIRVTGTDEYTNIGLFLQM